MTKTLNWQDFKSNIDSRMIIPDYFIQGDSCFLFASDGNLNLECKIDISDSEYTDFDTNYKSSANSSKTDSDNRPIVRTAVAVKGWSYLAKCFEFKSSTMNSLFSKSWDQVDKDDILISFFNDNGDELLDQASIDLECTKTEITLSPNSDYEVVSGKIYQKQVPIEDFRVWVIGGATDLGGSAVGEFAQGVNMAYVGNSESFEINGRVSKYMKITTEGVLVPTNKMKIIVKHSAGFKHNCMILIELFKK